VMLLESAKTFEHLTFFVPGIPQPRRLETRAGARITVTALGWIDTMDSQGCPELHHVLRMALLREMPAMKPAHTPQEHDPMLDPNDLVLLASNT